MAAHGVAVKVLTGNTEVVAARVCGRVGFLSADKVLLGPQVEAMNDAALALAAEQYQAFAKLSPFH